MKSSRSIRTIAGLVLLLGTIAGGTLLLSRLFAAKAPEALPVRALPEEAGPYIERVNEAFSTEWSEKGIEPTPKADLYTVVRRLSLALTGAPPSLEELRKLDELPPDADPVQSWLDHLFEDPRYHSYFAERLARTYVGVETGPFLVYRRRRLVNWIGDQLEQNRPYDDLVRDLVSASGIWTTNPEANFITVSVVQGGNNEGPDEVKLAARTSRAFLGISLDCMQCHDDKFGDHWKQEHFHELAAFYAQAEVQLTGIREKRSHDYKMRFLGESEERVVEEAVPYRSDLLPEVGDRRFRLARWITHAENDAFSRATVNRVWGLLLGRPLHSPVDDIPLEGPFPAGMEEMAAIFVESKHNLQSLIRLIAASEPFQRSSQSDDPTTPVTQEQEAGWAAFPITPLRSEQVAGGIIQAASLQAIDRDAHIINKIRRYGETRDFVKRYGDQGENEFAEEAGTIPQRLLLMNGKLVAERTGPNPIMNSSTRLANYASSDEEAVEAAFLATLTRMPTTEEKNHFSDLLADSKKKHREHLMSDLYWALINSTEFSWNR